jgi:hypothetical protein
MKFYQIFVTGFDDGYAQLLGGLRIGEGMYVLKTNDEIGGILKSIQETADRAEAKEISADECRSLALQQRGILPLDP